LFLVGIKEEEIATRAAAEAEETDRVSRC